MGVDGLPWQADGQKSGDLKGPYLHFDLTLT